MQQSYPSTSRVVRDDVLVYAEGDPIPLSDADELVAQGHITPAEAKAIPPLPAPDPIVTGAPLRSHNPARFPSKERVERDGYLVYAVGDDIPASDVDELNRQGYLGSSSTADPVPAPAAAPDVLKMTGKELDAAAAALDPPVTLTGKVADKREQLAAVLAERAAS